VDTSNHAILVGREVLCAPAKMSHPARSGLRATPFPVLKSPQTYSIQYEHA